MAPGDARSPASEQERRLAHNGRAAEEIGAAAPPLLALPAPGAGAQDPPRPAEARELAPEAGRRAGKGEEERTRLALAARAGDHAAFATLYETLRAPIAHFLAVSGRALPPTLEPGDLWQESWRMLAALVERWQPARGEFGAFFYRSFPWELRRYLARERRAGRGSEPHDVLVERLALHPDEEGEGWVEDALLRVALAALPERCRQAVVLRVIEGRTYTEISLTLGVSRTRAHALVEKALAHLRPLVTDDESGGQPEARGQRLARLRSAAPASAPSARRSLPRSCRAAHPSRRAC